jgi:hypothetical protein
MRIYLTLASLLALTIAACGRDEAEKPDSLVGAWRGGVQFKSGAFAAIKDLDFLYVFNQGGTMTESSNYDGSPPVPPAYGTWQKVGKRKYAAKYVYYWTKPPMSFDEIAKGNGWLPGGYGVLTQEITLAVDRNAFESTLRLQLFDSAGKTTDQESVATARAVRIQP